MKKTAFLLITLAYAAAFAHFGPLHIRLIPSFGDLEVSGAEEAGKAPGFRLPAARGGELDLDSFAGRPVLLMFFTEACPYCRLAGPALEKLSKEYASKGLAVIGVCVDDDKDSALAYAGDLGVTFPLAYGGRSAFVKYRARGVPYIYLLDGGRKLQDVWEGFDPSYVPMMKASLDQLLAGK